VEVDQVVVHNLVFGDLVGRSSIFTLK